MIVGLAKSASGWGAREGRAAGPDADRARDGRFGPRQPTGVSLASDILLTSTPPKP